MNGTHPLVGTSRLVEIEPHKRPRHNNTQKHAASEDTHAFRARSKGMSCSKFSKLSAIVIVYSKFFRELTFENIGQNSQHSQKTDRCDVYWFTGDND